MGQVEDVDIVDEGVGWGEFLRVHILFDLSKPLSSGKMLKLPSTSIWVAFQYEKLPNFCFWCGLIRHGQEGCLKKRGSRSAGEGDVNQFGSWLKALLAKRSWEGRKGAGGTAVEPHPTPGRMTAGNSSGVTKARPSEGCSSGDDDKGAFDGNNSTTNPLVAGGRGLAISVTAVEKRGADGGFHPINAATNPVTLGEGFKSLRLGM